MVKAPVLFEIHIECRLNRARTRKLVNMGEGREAPRYRTLPPLSFVKSKLYSGLRIVQARALFKSMHALFKSMPCSSPRLFKLNA